MQSPSASETRYTYIYIYARKPRASNSLSTESSGPSPLRSARANVQLKASGRLSRARVHGNKKKWVNKK